MEEELSSRPGTFGFNEATRRFELPPPSGVPELNIYASRSTIDTGLLNGAETDLFTNDLGGVTTQQNQTESLTVNEGIGARLTLPMQQIGDVTPTLSGGVDWKRYTLTTTSALIFISPGAAPVTSALPTNALSVEYLPITFRFDLHRPDGLSSTDFGIGYTVNFSGVFGQRTNFENVAGSTHADGNYSTIAANLSRDQALFGNWRLTLRADGQWANQPLISNEQFGIGGINGVRGYREGELFGDTGWRVTSEFKTPPHVIGDFGSVSRGRLTVRASVFMDYAEIYLLDPQGRSPRRSLWGTGIAGAASLGHNWEARLMLGIPLLSTDTTEAGQMLVNFSLSAQF
jgi:hypothetical protein